MAKDAASRRQQGLPRVHLVHWIQGYFAGPSSGLQTWRNPALEVLPFHGLTRQHDNAAIMVSNPIVRLKPIGLDKEILRWYPLEEKNK
jgi:hypothetical protein